MLQDILIIRIAEEESIPNESPKFVHTSACMDLSVSATPMTSTNFERGKGGEPFTVIWLSSVDLPNTIPLPSDCTWITARTLLPIYSRKSSALTKTEGFDVSIYKTPRTRTSLREDKHLVKGKLTCSTILSNAWNCLAWTPNQLKKSAVAFI